MTSVNLIGAPGRSVATSVKGEVSFGIDNDAKYRLGGIKDCFTSFADKQKAAEGGCRAPFPQKPSSIDNLDWYSVDPDERQEKFFTSFADKEARKNGKKL